MKNGIASGNIQTVFTNQRVLGLILIIFITFAGGYFAFSKFKQEVGDATASPTPSPSDLNFLLNQTPAPTGSSSNPSSGILQIKPSTNLQTNKQATPQPVPSERPLEKNKRLSQFPGILTDESLQNKKAVFQTAKGTVQIQIYPDTPLASSNFMILAASGFYDSLTFHRVEPGFVVQGGDPNGDGSGGPGYTFADEAVTREYSKGTVAMANSGPNTNGSQFFILLADHPELPKQYTIFGKVISGMDLVENLKVGDIIQKAIIQNL